MDMSRETKERMIRVSGGFVGVVGRLTYFLFIFTGWVTLDDGQALGLLGVEYPMQEKSLIKIGWKKFRDNWQRMLGNILVRLLLM